MRIPYANVLFEPFLGAQKDQYEDYYRVSWRKGGNGGTYFAGRRVGSRVGVA
jgi:hypothetical protein